MMEKTISYRFRSKDQYLMSSLAYHLELLSGNRQTERLNLEYLHPTYSNKKLMKKIRNCEKNHRIKSVCVQSLDMIGEIEQNRIFDWMDRVLGIPAGI